MKLERGKLRRQGVLLYLAAFSMIVVLIIAIMGGYLYRFYHRTIYENFVESNETDLGAIESRHENDMEIISNVVSQINLSADCTEFMLDKQPLKSTKLEEQLYQYTSVSQFFGQVLYFYHGDKYLYNSKTSITLDNFVQMGLVLEEISEQAFHDLLCAEDYKLKVLPEQKASGYVKVRYMNDTDKLTVYLKTVMPKKNAVMVFLVPEKYYDELLGSGGSDGGRNHYILYDGQIVTKRETVELESDSVLTELTNLYAKQTEKLNNSNQKEMAISESMIVDGVSMLVSMKAGVSGLVYVTGSQWQFL